MRYFSVLLIITFILIASGCTAKDAPDINELTELMNKNEDINLNPSQMLTTKNKYIEYTFFYNSHTLFQAYSDEKGNIIACTITNDKQDKSTAENLVNTAISVLCHTQEEALNKASDKSQASSSNWNYKFTANAIADYHIIYNSKFELGAESLPKLKNDINSTNN